MCVKKIFRPPRSSHCAKCQVCIERFDHHCPWLGVCIGKRNHKDFILYLFFTLAEAGYIFVNSLVHLIKMIIVENYIEFDNLWKWIICGVMCLIILASIYVN